MAAQAATTRSGTMHDLLFENQDALEPDDLLGYAEAAGVDPAVVAADLASRRDDARASARISRAACGAA